MTHFAATFLLRVTGPDRAAHFQQVVDAYADLERETGYLLDCAWSLSDADDYADVDVEVTVAAEDPHAAQWLASGSIRSAIHAAGGYTPGWDPRAAGVDAVAYELREEEEVVPV